ncbi:MAG: hypothetical protein HZB31_08040 [Nitrospirae bacterium]|nr:hypothetical protein [Nitrospirota bacterium]
MRRTGILLMFLLLFSASAYAGDGRAAGTADRVERQTGDVRVVVYMTTW